MGTILLKGKKKLESEDNSLYAPSLASHGERLWTKVEKERNIDDIGPIRTL